MRLHFLNSILKSNLITIVGSPDELEKLQAEGRVPVCRQTRSNPIPSCLPVNRNGQNLRMSADKTGFQIRKGEELCALSVFSWLLRHAISCRPGFKRRVEFHKLNGLWTSFVDNVGAQKILVRREMRIAQKNRTVAHIDSRGVRMHRLQTWVFRLQPSREFLPGLSVSPQLFSVLIPVLLDGKWGFGSARWRTV
jgi:hypothetical protein